MLRKRTWWTVRALTTVVCAAAFVTLAAAPAGAHGLAGTQPSNFATRVLSVSPSIPGVHVEVRDLGSRLELRNDTASDVVVLGYSGEPYLRVGPAGVYENRRSPAVFLNRSATVVANPPSSYSASAPPQWHRISRGHTVVWHDHRIHWMGASNPPVVQGSPGRAHLIDDWLVTMQYRGGAMQVRGDLRWVPGPSSAPRLLLALLVGLLVIGFGLTRWWGGVVTLSLAVLAAIVTVLVAGEWSATSAGPWIAFLSSVYSLLGVVIALAAVAALIRSRREPSDSAAIVLVAAVVLTFGSGLADVTYLDRSQLPTTLAVTPVRTMVAIVLGGSIGVLITAARHLRRPALVTIPAARPEPTGVRPAAPGDARP